MMTPIRAMNTFPRAIATKWARIATVFAIAAVYSASLVWLSTRYFRLSGFPVVDDVFYFNEGIKLLKTLDTGGVAALLDHVRQNPLHGPLSSVQAAVVFALFGIRDWLPYASMFLCVAAWLYAVDRIGARCGLAWAARSLLYVFALASPVAVRTVVVYQPVFPCSVAMALGTLAYLAGWPSRDAWRYRIGAVLCWALALLFKPSFSPQIALTMAVAAVLGVYVSQDGHSLRMRLRAYAVNLAIAVVLVTPYYLSAASYLYNYIRAVTQNPPERFDLNWLGHLMFHVTGPGGQLMLGGTALTLAALTAAWIGLAIRGPLPGERRFLGSLLAIMLMNFILFAVNPHKQEYIAPPFHYLFLLMAVVGAARVMQHLGALLHVRAAMAALALCTVLLAARVDYLDPWMHGDWKGRRALMTQITHSLVDNGAGAGKRVFFTTSGFISVTAVWYQMAKSGTPVPEIFDYAFAASLDPMRDAIAASDYVVASAPGNPDVWDFLPSTKLAGESLSAAQEDSGLTLIAHPITSQGYEYFVFKRSRGTAPGNASR